ncbi:hypothetical protein QBC47DRAFT_366062 [Echria macrotheca]|uniref:Uncharacterized protein n=1 Tax=Echria macrotheca TaxID=438768 RepID=A0AAJ0B0X0_9PEZI|nr:hypothetical protein QBC47DRAFT_366062 [Echria macrotheca]
MAYSDSPAAMFYLDTKQQMTMDTGDDGETSRPSVEDGIALCQAVLSNQKSDDTLRVHQMGHSQREFPPYRRLPYKTSLNDEEHGRNTVNFTSCRHFTSMYQRIPKQEHETVANQHQDKNPRRRIGDGNGCRTACRRACRMIMGIAFLASLLACLGVWLFSSYGPADMVSFRGGGIPTLEKEAPRPEPIRDDSKQRQAGWYGKWPCLRPIQQRKLGLLPPLEVVNTVENCIHAFESSCVCSGLISGPKRAVSWCGEMQSREKTLRRHLTNLKQQGMAITGAARGHAQLCNAVNTIARDTSLLDQNPQLAIIKFRGCLQDLRSQISLVAQAIKNFSSITDKLHDFIAEQTSEFCDATDIAGSSETALAPREQNRVANLAAASQMACWAGAEAIRRTRAQQAALAHLPESVARLQALLQEIQPWWEELGACLEDVEECGLLLRTLMTRGGGGGGGVEGGLGGEGSNVEVCKISEEEGPQDGFSS